MYFQRNVSPLSSPQLTRKMNGDARVQMTQTSLQPHFKTPEKVAVSVEIHEKHIIERVEIASVAYMIIFGSSMNNFVE
jgi:hypothetical protein